MDVLKMRTVSPEEMENRLANENSKEQGAAIEVLKIIGGTFCCLIAAAIVTLFTYAIFSMPESETECTIVKWEAINKLCELGMRCLHSTKGIIIVPISLAAILIELLCAKPINYVLRKLPLGRIPTAVPDTMQKIRGRSSILPALIVGLHITFQALATEFAWTSGITFSEKIIPVTIVLVGISLLVLLANSILQAGLWGFLIRGSLILVSNFGLAIVFGYLGGVLGMLLVVLAIILIALIVIPIIFKFTAIALW